jgi:hypothetical protein
MFGGGALDVCDEASMRAVQTCRACRGRRRRAHQQCRYGLEGAFEEVPMTVPTPSRVPLLGFEVRSSSGMNHSSLCRGGPRC